MQFFNVSELEKGVINLFHFPLPSPDALLPFFWSVLSDNERIKANAFHFHSDRAIFLTSRGLLRCFLGKYLDISPQLISLSCHALGKPFLDASCSTMQFNLSHTADYLILAFSNDREIGVDVERIRLIAEYKSIVGSYFSLEERDYICSQPKCLQMRAFFYCWTRKEALFKALGLGIGIGLESWSQLSCLEKKIIFPSTENNWTIESIALTDSHPSAIAYSGWETELRVLGIKWEELSVG